MKTNNQLAPTFSLDGLQYHFSLRGETILSIDSNAISYEQAEDIYIALLKAMEISLTQYCPNLDRAIQRECRESLTCE